MDGCSNNDENNTSNVQDGREQAILCSACTVRGADGSIKRGQLLEVRFLWTPVMIANTECAPLLYGFVRVKDVDHRLSGWFRLDNIEVKESRGSSKANGGSSSAGMDHVAPHSPSAACISGAILSSVYSEVTPGMARTRREEKQLDFFEERLLRDCRTPTTIRYFIYLCTFVFAPWYYAPYGIFHAEYDPLMPVSSEEERRRLGLTRTDLNPYVRDAYLCPFSLRIYSTFEQMQHETKCYRYGRLRPPGQEIYRDEARGFSMFEVNGSRQVTYCRHLFLLGKSFLENKLAGHDVHNYYFYVVCLHQWHFPHYTDDSSAMYFVGYFTWEKQVAENNLACIVTLPCFSGGATRQTTKDDKNDENTNHLFFAGENRRPPLGNFGQFMIAASYELAYRRKQVGSPERPLSDLGASAYERFWRRVLILWMHALLVEKEEIVAVDREISDSEQNVRVITSETATTPVRRSKRSHTSSTNSYKSTCIDADDAGDGDDGDDPARSASQADTVAVVSIRSIAQRVQLEEGDVVRTLLQMGLLHRNAEDRTLRLVIPVAFVHREYAKAMREAKDLSRATFDSALLTVRSSLATVSTSPQAPQGRGRGRGAAVVRME